MRTEIDLSTWARRDHYAFFSRFEEPFFGVTVEVECTNAFDRSQEGRYSFFLAYLFAALKAANETAPFRYRISEGKLWDYDVVHASPTINRPDGTFGFAYMDYDPDFTRFRAVAEAEIARLQESTGLVPAVSGENVLHFSALPWLKFTSIQHARAFSFPDSCPKIAFGKMTKSGGRRTMPVSIHVHHALMDGYHVGEFVERLEKQLGA